MNRLFASILTLLLLLAGSGEAQVVLRYGDNIDGGWGDASSVATPYVKFPKTFVAPYASCRITSVKIGLCKPATNVYVYIKNSPQDSKPLYRQKVGNLEAGWNDIQLDTPFDISGNDDIAIGYKASFAEAGGVGYSDDVYADGDIIYYNSQNKWTSTRHSLCIKAVAEGDGLPQNELLMGRMASLQAPYEAAEMTFCGWVRNVGGNAVDGYSLRYSFGGVERTVDIGRRLEVNATDSFAITVPSTEKGVHPLWVSVNTVGGGPDAYLPNDTARATLTVRDPALQRTVVCEEYTGLWCGWCPRGLVGLELMKEAHPGQFIAVSVHGGDDLEIADGTYNYKPFTSACSGAPMCNVDRRLTGDPFYDINGLYAMEQTATNHIAYTLAARWNADSTAIDVVSDFYSDIDIAAPAYNVAYTVTEDSVTGYTQTNYYSGNDTEFYGWEKKPGHTDDVVFNDVARAVYPSYEGDVCRTEPMAAYQHYTHTYTIPLPSNVADRRNIHVVGQIIDHATGYIANAMSCTPKSGDETGVVSLEGGRADGVGISRCGQNCVVTAGGAVRVEVFSASGMLVDSCVANGTTTLALPGDGIAIVRVMKDGRCIKTVKLN